MVMLQKEPLKNTKCRKRERNKSGHFARIPMQLLRIAYTKKTAISQQFLKVAIEFRIVKLSMSLLERKYIVLNINGIDYRDIDFCCAFDCSVI